MRLPIPKSDCHTQVKISVIGSDGKEMSSETVDFTRKTVDIPDNDWCDPTVDIVYQFIGENGRPDKHSPAQFLKKRMSHATPAKESEPTPPAAIEPDAPAAEPCHLVDSIEHGAEGDAPAGNDEQLCEAVLHQGTGHDELNVSGTESPASDDLSHSSPQHNNWGLPPVKRNKR